MKEFYPLNVASFIPLFVFMLFLTGDIRFTGRTVCTTWWTWFMDRNVDLKIKVAISLSSLYSYWFVLSLPFVVFQKQWWAYGMRIKDTMSKQRSLMKVQSVGLERCTTMHQPRPLWYLSTSCGSSTGWSVHMNLANGMYSLNLENPSGEPTLFLVHSYMAI